MPERHALLGPSSAHRWLVCTPSARLEEGIEDKGSIYADEGTLAHKLSELTLRAFYEGADTAAEILAVTQDPLYAPAMMEYVQSYVGYIAERLAEAKSRCGDPKLFIEAEISFDEYVPEGFGTADCVIIADGLMDVIDLKYGAGKPVSAADNKQMEMYALGCLLEYSWIYGIDAVRMTIFQPRLDSISTDMVSADSLMAWAEGELKQKAAQAWAGTGDFCPGEKTCQWCKVGATCKARADYQLELARYDFEEPKLMDAAAIADVLGRLPDLLAWANSVGDYALDQAVNHGVRYPGWKVVEGISRRQYADEDAIAQALRKAGFKVADIFKPKALKGITDMEKFVGKKQFTELAGSYIVKPAGKPTLVTLEDKRPEVSSAASAAEDFSDG